MITYVFEILKIKDRTEFPSKAFYEVFLFPSSYFWIIQKGVLGAILWKIELKVVKAGTASGFLRSSSYDQRSLKNFKLSHVAPTPGSVIDVHANAAFWISSDFWYSTKRCLPHPKKKRVDITGILVPETVELFLGTYV